MTQPAAPTETQWPRCHLCGERHDEVINLLLQAEYRRIADDDLAAELAYVERELLETNEPELEASLKHRLAVLQDEERRRRRLASQGGPLYKGQSSVSKERIAAVKEGVDLVDLLSRDLRMAYVRGDRVWFYCPAHAAHGAEENNASLLVYTSQQRWWCFGCNSGGDAIDWVIAKRGLEFRQAVEELERWRGIS